MTFSTIFAIIRFYVTEWFGLDVNILLDYLLVYVPTASLSSALLMDIGSSVANIPTGTSSSITLKAAGSSGANMPTNPLSRPLLMAGGPSGANMPTSPLSGVLLMDNGSRGGNTGTGGSGYNTATGSSYGGPLSSRINYIDKHSCEYYPGQLQPSPFILADSPYYTKQHIIAFNRVSTLETQLMNVKWEKFNAERHLLTAKCEMVWNLKKPGFNPGFSAYNVHERYYEALSNRASAEIQVIERALATAKEQKSFFIGGKSDVAPLKNP